MVDVSMSGLADTVENTDMHSASTINIAILLFIVASLVKASDDIVAIKIPILNFLVFISIFFYRLNIL